MSSEDVTGLVRPAEEEEAMAHRISVGGVGAAEAENSRRPL
jgi:hypothetical protein